MGNRKSIEMSTISGRRDGQMFSVIIKKDGLFNDNLLSDSKRILL